MVSRGVRESLDKNLTARNSLVPLAQLLARELRVKFAHARTATDTAISLDKGHRRRIRKGVGGRVPEVLRPFLIAEAGTFHLNPETGHVRLSLRAGEWVGFDLRRSDWHQSVFASAEIKQLRLNPHHAVLILEKPAPELYEPRAVLALDTNECSLDRVLLGPKGARPVVVLYPKVSALQHRYFVLRRRLGRKKTHDRRVGRILGRREGRRERARVLQRMHLMTKWLVVQAKRRKAVVVLEDLRLPPGEGRGRRMGRRPSSWPQGELHRQIAYKAGQRGVPVV